LTGCTDAAALAVAAVCTLGPLAAPWSAELVLAVDVDGDGEVSPVG
jgi:hypothetical protein